MYVAKVAVKGFSPYIYLCKLAAYCFWPCKNMPGLSPSPNEEGIILDSQLTVKLELAFLSSFYEIC